MVEQGTLQPSPAASEEMLLRYKTAVERVLPHLPVKNGVIDIDSIWIETSLPYEVLHKLLRREDLQLPDNVERINTNSRVSKQGEQRGPSKKKRRR